MRCEPSIGQMWKTTDGQMVVVEGRLALKRWMVREAGVRNAPLFAVVKEQLSVQVENTERFNRVNRGQCFRTGDPVWVGTTEGTKVKAVIMDIQPEWIIVKFKDDTRWQQNRNCFPCYAVKAQHVELRCNEWGGDDE